MQVEKHLDRLLLLCQSKDYSDYRILSEVEKILKWLNEPENNTDENCRKIDFFVASKILADIDQLDISRDTREILFDLGGQLHDTHTSQKIAVNFESTPLLLLNRVQNLISNLSS